MVAQSAAFVKAPVSPSIAKAADTLLRGPNHACCSVDMATQAEGSSMNDTTASGSASKPSPWQDMNLPLK